MGGNKAISKKSSKSDDRNDSIITAIAITAIVTTITVSTVTTTAVMMK